jgi:copper resistance protein C
MHIRIGAGADKMKTLKNMLVAWFALLSLASTAWAHTHIQSSLPANGSTVAKAPTEFVLIFPEAVRATSLTVTKAGGKEQKIEKLPTASAARIAVPAPKLEDGSYTLDWRVAGKDGHVMSGKVQFKVGGKAQAGPQTPEGQAVHAH